jgi:hypothetical protein
VFIILDENFEVGGVFHLNIINYDNFINYGEIVLSSYRLGMWCMIRLVKLIILHLLI